MPTFTNQATLRYNGQSVASNVVTGQLRCPLSLTKTADVADYVPGGRIVYAVSIVNSGATDYEGLTLTDDLGGYDAGDQTAWPLAYVPDSVLYFINGVPQSDPTVNPGPPLVFSGINVPANGSVMVIYSATLTAAAPLTVDSEITNTATLTGPRISSPLQAQATITSADGPLLSIIKGLFPNEVNENGQLTYTFQIRNNGNEAAGAEAGIVVSDLFDPILENISVMLNGQPLRLNADYTYNQTTGQFETIAGRITVPAATFSQSVETGDWIVTPGEMTLTVTGTV